MYILFVYRKPPPWFKVRGPPEITEAQQATFVSTAG